MTWYMLIQDPVKGLTHPLSSIFNVSQALVRQQRYMNKEG